MFENHLKNSFAIPGKLEGKYTLTAEIPLGGAYLRETLNACKEGEPYKSVHCSISVIMKNWRHQENEKTSTDGEKIFAKDIIS